MCSSDLGAEGGIHFVLLHSFTNIMIHDTGSCILRILGHVINEFPQWKFIDVMKPKAEELFKTINY